VLGFTPTLGEVRVATIFLEAAPAPQIARKGIKWVIKGFKWCCKVGEMQSGY
jgi:hypothetical protein